MKQSLFERAIAAGASNEPQAIRDLHHPEFFAVWETSFANLDEHLKWLLVDIEKNPPTINVECLHEDKMSIIMKNTREDGSEVYVMSLKKEDLFYRAIFSSERP